MFSDILQPTHLLFVLVIALLVLGPKRLPEVGRALGRGLRDFRHALSTDEIRDQMLSATSTQSTTPMTQQPTETTKTPVGEPAGEPSADQSAGHESSDAATREQVATPEPH